MIRRAFKGRRVRTLEAAIAGRRARLDASGERMPLAVIALLLTAQVDDHRELTRIYLRRAHIALAAAAVLVLVQLAVVVL